MGKKNRIIAVLLALALTVPMAACNSGNESKDNVSSTAASEAVSANEESPADESTTAESSEEEKSDTASFETEDSTTDAETTSESLKGVFNALLKNDGYKEYKSYYQNTTFEEKLVGDSIVIDISGTDGIEGKCTFPFENGYLICNASSDDFLSSMIYSMYILSSLSDYYEMSNALFVGYTAYLQDTGSEDYVTDMKEDGSGTIKINIDKKPDLSVLDESYITEEAVSKIYNEQMTNFTMNYGKMLMNSFIDKEKNSLVMAIGEFGDMNTESTVKSVQTIVNLVKPEGYEDFLKDFTEVKELKTDKYSVSFDAEAYTKETDVQLDSDYKFVIIKIGE